MDEPAHAGRLNVAAVAGRRPPVEDLETTGIDRHGPPSLTNPAKGMG